MGELSLRWATKKWLQSPNRGLSFHSFLQLFHAFIKLLATYQCLIEGGYSIGGCMLNGVSTVHLL